MSKKMIQSLVLSASLVLGSFGAVSTSYARGSDVVAGAVILGTVAAVGYGLAKAADRHDQRHYEQARDNQKVVVIKDRSPAYRYDRKEQLRRPEPYRHGRHDYARNHYDRHDRAHYDHRDNRYYR